MSVNEIDGMVHGAEGSGSTPLGKAAEGMHLAGSAIATGGVAIILAAIAIPVSIGLGTAWGIRALTRRLQGRR